MITLPQLIIIAFVIGILSWVFGKIAPDFMISLHRHPKIISIAISCGVMIGLFLDWITLPKEAFQAHEFVCVYIAVGATVVLTLIFIIVNIYASLEKGGNNVE